MQLTNDVGTLVSAAVWFVFGSLIPAVVARGISWNVLFYAVLSLTLVRLVPVALALVRSGLGPREVLFLGWIGPRGLASILFGLIAIEDLHVHGLTAPADFVAEVIVVTVGLSVLLHGLTAGVIAARWPATGRTSDPTSRKLGDSNANEALGGMTPAPPRAAGRAAPGQIGRPHGQQTSTAHRRCRARAG